MRYQIPNISRFNSYINMRTPDGVKFILLANVIIFLFIELFGLQYLTFSLFGLVPKLTLTSYQIWQPLTYLFLHSGFFHILINMLVLWMFGRELEYRWGKRNFLIYYFITGIGSGLVTMIFNPLSLTPVVGASGAIYGILTGYTLLYPSRQVYIYGIFPVQIKYMMIFLGITAFIASIANNNSTISHLTHLSGMIIGFLYLKKNLIKNYIPKIKIHDNDLKSSTKNNSMDEIDIILEKLKQNGWEGLTEIEKNRLFSASKFYSKNQSPN